jgi:hypothetical protein
MRLLFDFALALICIDMVWVCVEKIVDGYATFRKVDLIMGIIWALTLVIKDRGE